MHRTDLLRPDRLRQMERPFGWVPFRLLSSGLLTAMSRPAQQMYFFLCLVADAQGMSCYGDHRLGLLLKLGESELLLARSELLRRDLVAYDGSAYQLLSWPGQDDQADGVVVFRKPDSPLPQAGCRAC